MSTSQTLKHATVSAYAFDITRSQALGAIRPDTLQTPASITKLVTSAAALHALGTGFRYQTAVRIPNRSNAAVPQPIYLVGGGDPLLEANGAKDLEELARTVATKVKTAVNVVGVSSLFDDSPYEPGWPIGDLPHSYGAGSSALMAEQSQIEVVVHGSTPGRPPSVRLVFVGSAQAPAYFRIVNHGITAKPGQTENLVVTRQLDRNDIVVNGVIAASHSSTTYLSVENSGLFAATLFQQLLSKCGVHFTSSPATGTVPTGTVQIATHQSDTLANLLKIQNQYSVNTMAENLYRTLGAKRFGLGTAQAARAVVTDFLGTAGVSTTGMQLYDGSGLSPLNAMSARQMVGVLTYAAKQPWFPVFEHSLMRLNDPVNSGVLRYHPFALPKGAEVWLKTGNLSNQWNYAGYAKAENGDLIAFAILDDGPPTDLNARGGTLDEMVIDAARFPNEPVSGQQIVDSLPQPGGTPHMVASFLQSAHADVPVDQILGASVVKLSTGQPVWGVDQERLLHAGLLPRLALAEAALKSRSRMSSTVTVYAVGRISSGVLNGSLLIAGRGCPTVTEADLQKIAQTVVKTGLREVTGPIEYVNQSDGQALWSDATTWDSAGEWWAPPVSNVSVNNDVVQFSVNASAGGTPSVTVEPTGAPIGIINRVAVATGTATAGVRASLNWGTNSFVLQGLVLPNQAITIQAAPPNAEQVAAIAFRDALEAVGINVPVQVQTAVVPASAPVVARWTGPDVRQLAVQLLGTPSNALPSEVFALLGNQADKQVRAFLTSVDQVQDVTGNGLENYMTPASVTDQLRSVWKEPEMMTLKQFLSARPWVVTTPRLRTVVGYWRGTDGLMYAITVFENTQWQGDLAPIIDR